MSYRISILLSSCITSYSDLQVSRCERTEDIITTHTKHSVRIIQTTHYTHKQTPATPYSHPTHTNTHHMHPLPTHTYTVSARTSLTSYPLAMYKSAKSFFTKSTSGFCENSRLRQYCCNNKIEK